MPYSRKKDIVPADLQPVSPERSGQVPLPAHPELRSLCVAFLGEPGSAATAAEWAARVGMSEKTFTRLFRREVRMTFGAWRRLVRVAEARRRLASGERVTRVALDLGYESISAFTAMFRRATGTLPSMVSMRSLQRAK
jgi:AraC-like DNA-binding protein